MISVNPSMKEESYFTISEKVMKRLFVSGLQTQKYIFFHYCIDTQQIYIHPTM